MMFSTAFEQRLPDCQKTEEIPKLLPISKPKNKYLLDELDDDTLSLLEDADSEILHRAAVKQCRKRRIYSNVHLDPKKSGRRFRANDRERRRMESLNGALDALKGCIPVPKSKKRMTKLYILRQACSYIKSLTEVLQAAAVELSDGMDVPFEMRNRNVINGLSIAQRLDLLSRSGRFYHFRSDVCLGTDAN